MNDEILKLKEKSGQYKILYNLGKCTRKEAEDNIMPYINKVNEKGLELAKKYNQKYKKVWFNSYIR
ncbi:MAG TPA: hypothetical protein VIK86_02020 [Candidatus Paceibacterota bacterium]